MNFNAQTNYSNLSALGRWQKKKWMRTVKGGMKALKLGVE